MQPFKDQEDHPSQYAFGWRHHYPGHECQCRHCSPLAFPHLAEATWDAIESEGTPPWPSRILVDGDPLPRVATCKEGAEGWVIAQSLLFPQIHACETCFQAACEAVVYGHVTVEWEAEVPA